MERPPHVFLVSDVHLGAPNAAASREREARLVRWLSDVVQPQATELIILGDLFDFWFEYRHVAPKGYVRLLGKLAELADGGLPITLFTGNHDLWLGDYLAEEIGLNIQHGPQERHWFGKRWFLAHGDGLGPGDQGFKLMKRVFQNPLAQWAFRWLHPDLGVGLAQWASRSSRQANLEADAQDHGEQEYLYQFVQQQIAAGKPADVFIFGHRHLPKDEYPAPGVRFINLGDWITHFTYLEIQATATTLRKYEHGA